MFEKLRSGETAQKAADTFYWAMKMLRLAEVEKVKIPEPYFAIIDGKPYRFSYDDTHVARCAENPEFSAIVHTFDDEKGRPSGLSIYGQPKTMEDLEGQGFDVVDESLKEAEANYHLYHPRGNEQAQLN
jgi:hypothetical protein